MGIISDDHKKQKKKKIFNEYASTKLSTFYD